MKPATPIGETRERTAAALGSPPAFRGDISCSDSTMSASNHGTAAAALLEWNFGAGVAIEKTSSLVWAATA